MDLDHVNSTLLLSLKQDLYSLNESIEYMNKDKVLASWLFPTKNHDFVKQYIEEKNISKVTNVKIILELILDRLYVGIRLILMSIQDKIEVNDFEDSLILQPQQMTIGCCFDYLRKMVDTLIETLIDQNSPRKKEIIDDNVVVIKDVKTQTEIVSLDKCDSCASAVSCMKNLLQLFDIHKDNIYDNDQLKSNIYGLTQFGCMMQSTITIEKCLKALLSKNLDKEEENEDLRSKLGVLNKKLQKKSGKIIRLEQDCTTLTERNKKISSDIVCLKLQIDTLNEQLSESEKKKATLKKYLDTLISQTTKYKENTEIYHQQITHLTNNLEKLKDIIKDVFKRLPNISTNIEAIEEKYNTLDDNFVNLTKIVDNLFKALDKTAKNQTELDNKMKKICSESKECNDNFNEQFQGFQSKIQNLIIHLRINSCQSIESIPKLEIKGNPIEDINKQIEENNERIKKLQDENVKLQSIVSKYKSFKK